MDDVSSTEGLTSPLTSAESKAIGALEQLAKKWPKSLWLFSANGSLCVMKKDSTGKRVLTALGGADPDTCVATINIENEGGDW